MLLEGDDKVIKKLLITCVVVGGLVASYFLLGGYKGIVKRLNPIHINVGTGTTQTLDVPIGKGKYVEVVIDGDNTLLHTNGTSMWKFTNTTVLCSTGKPKGYPYESGVFYDRASVSKLFNDKVITVIDSHHYYADTLQSLMVPTLKERPDVECTITSKPTTTGEIREFKELDNGIIVAADYEESSIENASSISYWTVDGFLNVSANYCRYSEACDAMTDYIKVADYSCYEDNLCYWAECGDSYIGVRKIDLTTCVVLYGKGQESRDFAIETIFQGKE